ncbi:IS200/IS605 family element transposase accessory protein TnpB [Candidatus Poribacteria bacterium]|nr:IS200/IS605 family element transposase accessory protein TnpB [Candidatus Poribacteria bacterium]MYH80956.1 IS200/IS605 family element transposase accessory protein TnpB [Candidatus Poribacteria bacterium]MYK94550.1 IS200/IS605 family element transposase accessory protein TnpB [Candidatus Poribacteria bacterium]
MSSFYRTQTLKIEPQPIFPVVNGASADVWNDCSTLMDFYQYERGYPHAHRDFYFGKDCEGWIDKKLSNPILQSQSRQAVRECYFKSWKSYSVLKKNGSIENPKPPSKRKKYMTTRFKKSAIRFVEGALFGKRVELSLARGQPKIDIPLPSNFNMSKVGHIATIDLCYNYGQWTLHFSYKYETETTATGEEVVGVDIGEIHPIVSHDGQATHIYNGRYIRSLYRLRNKVLANFSKAISQCKRHSKRWWCLTRRKWKRIRKIDNQIKDALHKQTTKFVKYCHAKGIGTIVLGNLTGIRKDIDYGKRANQKLHQWAFGKISELIIYKAKTLGIKVEVLDESYTSQTCPKCGHRKKPNNRNYTCKCGFKYHRDGVGAINIRAKYLGHFGVPVVAEKVSDRMTPPLGFRLTVPKVQVALSQIKECS